MQYLLLIYDNEAEMMARARGLGDTMMKEYREFTDSILKSGHLKAGDALQPTSTATSCAIRNGKTLTTDGPFAETQGAARRLLPRRGQGPRRGHQDRRARIPSAQTGTIEVRPIHVFAG